MVGSLQVTHSVYKPFLSTKTTTTFPVYLAYLLYRRKAQPTAMASPWRLHIPQVAQLYLEDGCVDVSDSGQL